MSFINGESDFPGRWCDVLFCEAADVRYIVSCSNDGRRMMRGLEGDDDDRRCGRAGTPGETAAATTGSIRCTTHGGGGDLH